MGHVMLGHVMLVCSFLGLYMACGRLHLFSVWSGPRKNQRAFVSLFSSARTEHHVFNYFPNFVHTLVTRCWFLSSIGILLLLIVKKEEILANFKILFLVLRARRWEEWECVFGFGACSWRTNVLEYMFWSSVSWNSVCLRWPRFARTPLWPSCLVGHTSQIYETLK